MTRSAVLPRLLLVLGALLASPRSAASASGPVPDEHPLDATQAAASYLAAFRSSDDASRDAAADAFQPDPFRVAAALFASHLEQFESPSDASGDFLGAAADLARRASTRPGKSGIQRLVDRWATLGTEELRTERAIARRTQRALDAVRKRDGDAVLAIAAEDRGLLDGATPAVAAVDLSLLEAKELFYRGRLRESIEAHRRALRAADALGWPGAKLGVFGALTGEAVGLQFTGELRAARSSSARQVQLAREIGWADAEHGALVNDAKLLSMLGDFAGALESYDRAQRYFDKAGPPRSSAMCAISHLQFLAFLGRNDESIRGLQSLLTREFVLGDPYLRAGTLQALGQAHSLAGQTAPALACFEQAAKLFGTLGAQILRIQCVRALGTTWAAAGDLEQAMRCYEAAESELARTPNAQESARLDRLVGLALSALGRTAEVSVRLERSLEFFSRSGDHEMALSTKVDLADCSLAAGRAAESAERCSRVLAEVAEGELPQIVDRARQILGDALLELGRHAEAETAWKSVAESAQGRGDLGFASAALSALARRAIEIGDPRLALSRAREASEAALLRATALGDEAGLAMRMKAAGSADVGLAACHALLRTGGDSAAGVPAEALRFVERGRTLTLLGDLSWRDVLVAVAVGRELGGRLQAARARAQAARSEIAALQARGASEDEKSEARANLDSASSMLEETEGLIRRRARLEAGPSRLESAEASSIQATLPAGTVLLDYRLGTGLSGVPARSTLVAVGRDWIDVVDLGGTEALASAAESFVGLTSTPGADDTAAAAELFERALRPIAPRLAGARRLLVSADPPLLSVPFEALVERTPEGPRRLIERFEVVLVPSGTVFASLVEENRSRPRGEWLLALGDPEYPEASRVPAVADGLPVLRNEALGLRRLSGSAAEVRELGSHFPEQKRVVLTGAQASSDSLTAALASRSDRLAVLHVACHGILDERRPLLSGLALAGGRILTVNEIYRMAIPADLAVLSACHSGGGRLAEDDSVASLVRAFLCAGCPRVVVSRWAVEDRATGAFMSALYRAHIRERRGAAEALRTAQLACLRSGGADAHPSRWAAFALWGLPE